MNTKNRLIEKLLKVAKKHKILTYPVLALVAVISVFNYFFSWSTGAGKRVVAVVMVLVMLVSQSYFLTSSATALVDTEETKQEQLLLQEQSEEELVDDSAVSEEADEELVATEKTTEVAAGTETTTEASSETSSEVTSSETTTEVNEGGESITGDVFTEDDTTQEGNIPVFTEDEPQVEQAAGDTITCTFATPDNNRIGVLTATADADGVYRFDATEFANMTTTLEGTEGVPSAYEKGGYYSCVGWYTELNGKGTQISSNDLSKLSLTAGQSITLYGKKTLEKYKVYINAAEGTFNPSDVGGAERYDTDDEKGMTYYDIPVSGDNQASFTINNPTKVGYLIAGATENGASVGAVNGSVLTVNLSGSEYAKDITLDWAPQQYSIQYAAHDGTTGLFTQSGITFDDPTAYFASAQGHEDILDAKSGYKFKSWSVPGAPEGALNTGITHEMQIKTNEKLQKYLFENAPVTLRAEYDYAGVELKTNTVSLEYKKASSIPIVQGVYTGTDETSAGFQYTINSITVGGVDVSSTLESTYGITITESNSGSANGILITNTNGPKKVDDIVVDISITDTVADNKVTNDLKLTVSIAPRQLTIDPEKTIVPTKVYNGEDTTCDFKGQVPTNVENVYLNVTESKYKTTNAGDCMVELTLDSTKPLIVPDGDFASNYRMPSVYEIPGYIEQREVDIETYVDVERIRAGEPTPELKAREITSEADKAKDKGMLAGHNLMDYVNLALSPARMDEEWRTSTSTKKQTYEIRPKWDEESNYKFNCNITDIGSFEVVLEDSGSRYVLTEPKDDVWYGPNTVIQPSEDSGYSKISVNGAEPQPSVTLTEDNVVDNKITFQLIDTNGAFTTCTSIPLYVDLTSPVFDSYTVVASTASTGSSDGLFFPSESERVSFGNYFNKSVTFTIRYMDERSKPGKLYYTLGGSLGGASSNVAQEKTFDIVVNDNVKAATFEIPLGLVDEDKIGNIQFYAVDEAGNKSATTYLSYEGHNDNEKDGDEWAVEQTGPKTSELVVKSGEITVSDPDRYYSACTAYLTATDATAGIYSVTWNVNGEEYEQRVSDTDEKLTTTEFSTLINNATFPSETGEYEVFAYVTDNAGNSSVPTNTVTFKVDDVDPVLNITPGYDKYQQKVKLEFSAYDALSGLKYINVKDVNNNVMVQHVVSEVKENALGYQQSSCYFETTTKGEYIIEVSDYAGNVYTTEPAIVLDKVSNETPDCPTVTFDPEMNENGWFTADDVKAMIKNISIITKDNTPVDTKYQLWKDGETSMHVTTIDSDDAVEEVSLSDGIYKLKVWSESATGVPCATPEDEAHIHTIQVDSVEPTITYELQKGLDNSLLVNFKVTDDVSGVNGEKIQVYNGAYPVTAQVTVLEDGSGYVGNFAITEVGNYSIVAEDIAGNVATAPAFKPMSMRVNAVKNISTISATVGAHIFRGTYEIKSSSISYGKFADGVYTETDALPMIDQTTGNQSISAVLNGLEMGTNYVYKITAISQADEVLEYVGYFKTLSDSDAGLTITGTARYVDGRSGTITVGLFDGNNCIRAVEVDTTESNTFVFNNISDGNYSVVATDGAYTSTARLTIKDGVKIYPESSSVDLVLSGKNTSVELTTDSTPNITAGNMDSLFDDETNFTDEDKELVTSGKGTVEFKLYATLMKVSAVTSEEISAMYSATSNKNKLVGAYLDLSLYKIVTDEDGNVSKTRVTELGGGSNISVTIPLGELANKSGLEVVRIHDTGERYLGTYLADQDNSPYTYTVVSSQYSTYAILYDPEKEPATTEAIVDGTLDPSADGAINTPAGSTEVEPDDSTTEDDDNDKDEEKDSSKKGSSSVGSLRSSGSAKTGDATPVTVLFGLMFISVAGLIVLRKKIRD